MKIFFITNYKGAQLWKGFKQDAEEKEKREILL